MMVSEMLWVGTGPKTPSFGPIRRCATAEQAVAAMEENCTAVVPTTEVARDTLFLLGTGMAWAAFATQGSPFERNLVVDL